MSEKEPILNNDDDLDDEFVPQPNSTQELPPYIRQPPPYSEKEGEYPGRQYQLVQNSV